MQPYPPPPSVPPPFPPGGGRSYQQAPPGGGRSYLVPIVALATTFVLLVTAIMVVLVDRLVDRDDPQVTAGGDPCVVGRWRVDSYTEDVALPEPFGRTRFTGTGPGAWVELRADGYGTTDYGDGTTFDGVVSGIALTLTVTGQVTYRYRAVDGTVAFTDVDADGTVTLSGVGLAPQSDELTADFDPASYECTGDTLTQRTALYTARMSRR